MAGMAQLGELERVWRRIEEHEQQIIRLQRAQKLLTDENATLLELFQSPEAAAIHVSIQLHRLRFAKMLRRFPIAPNAATMTSAVQNPGMALITAQFAGLATTSCLLAACSGFRDPVGSALSQIIRCLQTPKIYVIGGLQQNQALDTVESFDPGACKWTPLPAMPTPRSDLSATAVGGKLYVMGGYDGRTLSEVELFDPRWNTWEILAPMPSPRCDFVAVAEAGHVYRVGGLDENYEALSTCQRFSPPHSSEWETLPPMRIARWSFAVATVQGMFYAIGGFADGQALDVVECLDPLTCEWEALSPMPTPRCAFAAATVGSSVYALGGTCPGLGPSVLSVVERYDPRFDTWAPLAPMPTARSHFAATAIGGKIYAIGGLDSSGVHALSVVERYDPDKDQWEALPPMPTARSGAAVLTCC